MTHTQRITRALVDAQRTPDRPIGNHSATWDSFRLNARSASELLERLATGADVPADCPLVVVEQAWLFWDSARAVRAESPDLH